MHSCIVKLIKKLEAQLNVYKGLASVCNTYNKIEAKLYISQPDKRITSQIKIKNMFSTDNISYFSENSQYIYVKNYIFHRQKINIHIKKHIICNLVSIYSSSHMSNLFYQI